MAGSSDASRSSATMTMRQSKEPPAVSEASIQRFGAARAWLCSSPRKHDGKRACGTGRDKTARAGGLFRLSHPHEKSRRWVEISYYAVQVTMERSPGQLHHRDYSVSPPQRPGMRGYPLPVMLPGRSAPALITIPAPSAVALEASAKQPEARQGSSRKAALR